VSREALGIHPAIGVRTEYAEYTVAYFVALLVGLGAHQNINQIPNITVLNFNF